MHQVLVYGDSLTWGIIPGTRERLPFNQRWPGILEDALNTGVRQIRIFEDCLNGRRTVWDDPFKPGRNGRDGLTQCIEMHSPLSLVILMLGTNDFQFCHPYNNAWSASQGIASLVFDIRTAPIEPGMPVPPILLVCPPPIQTPRGTIASKFAGAESRGTGLAAVYQEIAYILNCHFFDAGTVVTSSRIDGVHLDAEQHLSLGLALAKVTARLISLDWQLR